MNRKMLNAILVSIVFALMLLALVSCSYVKGILDFSSCIGFSGCSGNDNGDNDNGGNDNGGNGEGGAKIPDGWGEDGAYYLDGEKVVSDTLEIECLGIGRVLIAASQTLDSNVAVVYTLFKLTVL